MFAKILEFWKRYHRVVPDPYRTELKALNAELKAKQVREFRNTVAGHIWDTKKQRPLRHSEVMEKLKILTDGTLVAFLSWVNDPGRNIYPTTVLSIVEGIRDAIVHEHSIQPNEVLAR